MVDEVEFSTRQTHSGIVLIYGDRVYKFKKAVDLGFVDFRSRETRLDAVRREVELNHRLAPDVYLGVADVSGSDGSPCEHLVVMRRMPEDRRLATLVEAGEPLQQTVSEIARIMAEFHARAERSETIAAQGSRDALTRRWREHFRDLDPYRGEVLPAELVEEVERRVEDFLAGREPLFADRIAAGRIVDGHGGLMAEDIFCLDDGPRVLDCLDFDDRLRWLDGLDDAACLAMDLAYRGGSEWAGNLLERYVAAAADPAPSSLAQHYIAYRALMRAKVACLRHAQGDPQAATEAQQRGELARDRLRAGTVRLVLVGGLPGTGKSTLAGWLADRLGAVLLASDRVRKELAGLDPSSPAPAPAGEGIYSPAHSEDTYQALAERATDLLARGQTVVLDASWTSAARRRRAGEAAERTRSEWHALRCHAPTEVAAQRLRTRAGDASDADPHIAEHMAATSDSWPEAVTIDTTGTPEHTLQQALTALMP